MTDDSFFEHDSKVLTAGAFEFVLESELKRADRYQNYLTLVTVEASREWEGMTVTADDGTLEEVAQVIRREIRDTDMLGHTDKGTLGLVLLDADFDQSTRVIERLVTRIQNYKFPTALRIAIGAACYPTHAIVAESLKRQALSRPLVNWRGGIRIRPPIRTEVTCHETHCHYRPLVHRRRRRDRCAFARPARLGRPASAGHDRTGQEARRRRRRRRPTSTG